MEIFISILLSFIGISLLLIWYVNVFNRYQNYIIRINEAENNIDSTLRKRYDLLNKSIGIIETHVDTEEVFKDFQDLRSQKLSNFDLDRKLYESINEFNKYKEQNPNLKSSEEFMRIEISLHESEAEIAALRKYYNDIITDYNKLMRTFPSSFVGKTCKYKVKKYFDGKDMEDDDIKDFKL